MRSVKFLSAEEAQVQFGGMSMFVANDMAGSSAKTHKKLDWNPAGEISRARCPSRPRISICIFQHSAASTAAICFASTSSFSVDGSVPPSPNRRSSPPFGNRSFSIPYGVYDQTSNTGWVGVGIDHDTAEFAVETLRRWWRNMGRGVYPRATKLLVTADGGGSNGSRRRLWKMELQRFASETGLRISVCHFPPGTSKWNKIEHRMFCHITENWRSRPLVSREVVVNLIGNTRTETGLSIQSELDEGIYPTGRKVTDEQMKGLSIRRDKFHGEWNYTISPKADIG